MHTFDVLENTTMFEFDCRLLYDTIKPICDMLFVRERRWVEMDIFYSMLTEYYENKDFEVWFHLSDEHDYNIFHIEKNDSFYYYDLSRFQNKYIDLKGFWEFSNIYFPDECVITYDMLQLTSDKFPMKFFVKCYNECSENSIDLMRSIREHLTELKKENIQLIRKKAIKFLKKDLPIQEKYYALYYLISHSYFSFFDEEIRVIEYNVFISKLTEYYDKLNSDVEFKITPKREGIQTYTVRPRKKCYYYDKLESKGEFKELKEVFFPDEDITIKAIRRVDNDGDRIRLRVEKNNINNLNMKDFF